MGAHSRENKGATIENKIETSDCKAIHQDKAPMVRIHYMELKASGDAPVHTLSLTENPLHGVESYMELKERMEPRSHHGISVQLGIHYMELKG